MGNLMNKTKAQLIEIIERKDAVESKLRQENVELKDSLKVLSDLDEQHIAEREEALAKVENTKKDCLGTQEQLIKVKRKLHEAEILVDEFKTEIDDNAIRIATLKHDLKVTANCLFAAIAVIIVLGVAYAIL